MKCPVCRATYRSSNSLCRRCGVDLSPLIEIHDCAIGHHRQALRALKAGDIPNAVVSNDRALALNAGNAAFYALAGRLRALLGDLPAAIRFWQQALIVDAKHPTASRCLALLQGKSSPPSITDCS